MSDVQTTQTAPPETRPEERGPPASHPAASFGLTEWLRWAWRQLTSMRIALVLLFLLALASVPGSFLPQEGVDPGGVQQYYTQHPALAPFLNHLGLFNVFAAPWFAAIYILLFISLVGCVVPRTFRLVGSARSLPPKAPRNLARLPLAAEYSTELAPDAATAVAARFLSGRRFRLRLPDSPGSDTPGDAGAAPAGGSRGRSQASGTGWISAEKGYLREAGNLLFHLALLGVIVAIAMGGLFGYKADRLLVEGSTFADTSSALDAFYPGHFVTNSDLAPFTLTLNKFDAGYITSGVQTGQPSSYDAHISYTAQPGGPQRAFDLEVNHPLSVDGVKIFLIGHGFAPVFKVTDSRGHVVYDAATPFVSNGSDNYLSEGVVKVPGAVPQDLGFSGVFVPTAVTQNGTLEFGVSRPGQPGGEPGRLRGQSRPGLRCVPVGLPARHQRHAQADASAAGAGDEPVDEAAARDRHPDVHRLPAVGEPRGHP